MEREREREAEETRERRDAALRWDNPTSGQRRRSETADGRNEGDETTHGGKGVAMKLREGEEENETADRWKG